MQGPSAVQPILCWRRRKTMLNQSVMYARLYYSRNLLVYKNLRGFCSGSPTVVIVKLWMTN